MGGVPIPGTAAETAHSVIVNLTAIDAENATAITVWSPDDSDTPPDIVSLAGNKNHMATTTLALVRLGGSGQISVNNGGRANPPGC